MRTFKDVYYCLTIEGCLYAYKEKGEVTICCGDEMGVILDKKYED